MNIPVQIDSGRPVFLSVDLRGLANLYAGLSAHEQAQFFALVEEELKIVCGGRDWYQRDMIAIEVGKNEAAQAFVKYIATSSDEAVAA